MERADDTFYSQSMRGNRLTIFTQLRQAIEAMHYHEEMFQWLASVITQRFDVPVVQLWTYENDQWGQPFAQLLAMAYQAPFQPLNVVSEKAATIVERISSGQYISSSQPVEQMFPQYLALLLKRYGISYCAYCLIDRNIRFAQVEQALSREGTLTRFRCIVLLFLREYARQELISTIGIILEQAIVVAENRRLLLSVAVNTDRLSAPQAALSQVPPPALPGLIPRRKQDEGLMVSSNPFARPVAISDQQALRLYEAIDSRKTVAELCISADMTLNEAQTALQTLLSLQYIEIYTLEGWPVDATLLFKNR